MKEITSNSLSNKNLFLQHTPSTIICGKHVFNRTHSGTSLASIMMLIMVALISKKYSRIWLSFFLVLIVKLFFIKPFDQILRSIFHFNKNARNILSQHTNAYQLNARERKDGRR